MSDAFFTLHQDLPREGPGAPEDVEWALELLGLEGPVSVCDAACGPGADAETLAQSLREAQILAVDRHDPFVDRTRARLSPYGERVLAVRGDMAALPGRHDLIWCAGAVYFLGIEAALTAWRDVLQPGGHVVFSEPVFLSDPPTSAAAEFWADYPGVGTLEGIEKQVADAGWQVVGSRMIVGAPWAAYYGPQIARIAQLRQEIDPNAPDRELCAVLEEAEREIALWRAAPDQIAYALMVVKP